MRPSYGALLTDTVNVTPPASVLEIAEWLLCAAAMLVLFFLPSTVMPADGAVPAAVAHR